MKRLVLVGLVVVAGCGHDTAPKVTCVTLPKLGVLPAKTPVRHHRKTRAGKPAKRSPSVSGGMVVTVPNGAVFVPTPDRDTAPQKRTNGSPSPIVRRPATRLPSRPVPSPAPSPGSTSMLDQILDCVPSLKCLPLPQIPLP